MNSIKRGSVAALATLLAAGTFVVPPAPAEAQTLMDLFRGGPRIVRERQSPLIRSEPAPGYEQHVSPQREAVRAEPQPVVAGPKYYTYKAEGLTTVDFAALAAPLTTGAVDSSAATRSAVAPFVRALPYVSDLRVDALDEVASAVEAHYAKAAAFIWIDERGPNDRARAALSVLEAADSVGLDASDYRVAPLKRTGGQDARMRDRMRFEMDLSVKALTYVLDATRGRIDPNKISGYHDFKRKSVDLAAAMRVIARVGDVAHYLEARSPRHETFQALSAEWTRLAAEDERDDLIIVAEGTFMRPGGESEELPNVVAAIRARGSDKLKTDHALTFADYKGSQRYEGALVELVEAFQEENGLMSDGIVGRNTVLAMSQMTNAEKLEKLAFSMERLRWLNRDLGDRHVLINAASYRVSYVEDNEEALNMRVVVGTKANQTYFFQDQIETVEYNPYWGVPRSIIVNEMLPKLRRDPSYLDRLGYEVTTRSGTQVASSSVNWYGVGANVPYNVRQPPGASNALGELKILFPNSHAIYMHDTPAKDLFGRDSRAYSHGCVRLEDPRAMAAAILGSTKENVGTEIAQGRNKAVKVEADIPVYVGYFTAWPNADGGIDYFGDVYERDMYLKRAEAATDAARHAES
ncbi:L,D-transpeptidase family protein [Pararhizobium haloflavum]|uniref:L,D-transpeptidase family protein n=1 Tax=Pararhizobium haloflavum TaxID=2037914 RepID=UPI000C1A5BF8|nr:L,D-transpeptidase family protein [Pararhizobium haloflavum]